MKNALYWLKRIWQKWKDKTKAHKFAFTVYILIFVLYIFAVFTPWETTKSFPTEIGFDVTSQTKLSFYSNISSAVTLPLLFVTYVLTSWISHEKSMGNYEELKRLLGELRRIKTQQGLRELNKWLRRATQDPYQVEFVYISKTSTFPAFWLEGGRWLDKNLAIFNGGKFKSNITFAGPLLSSERFSNIAGIVSSMLQNGSKVIDNKILLAHAGCFCEQQILQHYDGLVKEMEKSVNVIKLEDEVFKELDVSIVILKTNNHLAYMEKSKYKVMFFDTSEVLVGGNLKNFEFEDVLREPQIFCSENETLGNLFRHIAYNANEGIKI